LARREKRLAKLAGARAEIEARAKERCEREKAEHEAKLAAREAKTKDRSDRRSVAHHAGDRRRVRAVLQRSGGGGSRQPHGRRAGGSNPDDKQQIAPMLKRIEALPADLGKPETLLADNGYFSGANVARCAPI
jgi:hypothetical protein